MMKNKVVALTKVFFKNSFQNMETAGGSKNKTNSKSMMILYAIVFLYLAGIVGFFSYNLVQGLIEIQQEEIFLGLILLAIGVFVLIQTIFSAISLLYYSKDNEYILPLPIKPSQIVMAKTNVLLITEYFIVAIIGLIPLIIYGILTTANIFYYITMIITLLTFPVVPVLISSLLVLIVMSFAKFTKNRNRFQIIATIILLVVICVISFQTSDMEGSQEELIQMATKANGLVEMIRNTFPTLGMAIEALANNSILNLIALVLVTAILYLIYIAVGQKLFLKGAVGSLSSGKRTKKAINEKTAFKKSSLAKTYIGKEFKTLIRNPIFFMQCVMPAILFPILVIVFTFAGMQTDQNTSITDIAQMITNKTSIYLGMAILMFIQFFSMFIYISATAISRDGQNAVFMKYIPVPLIKQIDYKVMPNIIMTTIMGIISIGIAQYLFRIPILYLLLITIAAISIGMLQSYLMIIVDLKKPKLEWNSEYAVVKQNMNLVWPMFLGLANITIIAVLSYVLGSFVNSFVIIGLFIIIYLGLTMLVRKYIENNADKLFRKIY